MIVKWMCGVSQMDRRLSADLHQSLDIENVAEMVESSRLRWFGHAQRKEKNERALKDLHANTYL